jgi:hypothetical protein
MVEGQPRGGLIQDVSKHRVGILEKLGRRNSECFDAGGPEPLISRFITPGLVAARVRLPIDFDRQSSIAAEEVEDIRSGGMLATELEPVRTLAEPMPEDHFWQRHFAPEPASIFSRA